MINAVTIDNTVVANDCDDTDPGAPQIGGDLVDVAVDAVEQFADRGGLQGREVLRERDAAQPAANVGRPVGGEARRYQTNREVADDHDDQRRSQENE